MTAEAARRSIVAVTLACSVVTLFAGSQQAPAASKVTPPLWTVEGPTIPRMPDASEVTVKLTASVTFRDDGTAGLTDGSDIESEMSSVWALVPGMRTPSLARGSSGAFSERRPFTKSSWDTARVGEGVQLHAVVGDPGNGDLCTIDVGPGRGPAEHTYALWRLDAQVVSAKYQGVGRDVFTLDLAWTRLGDQLTGRRAAVPERRRIVLSNEERHVLDFLAAPPGSASRCANVMLDVSASRRDDRSGGAVPLNIDVWFVHKDRAGRELRENQRVTVAPRRSMTALFEPACWTLTGDVVSAGSPDAAVRLDVVSQVRGSVLPDGHIELWVLYSWFVRAGRPAARPPDSASGIGSRGDTGRPAAASQSGPSLVRTVSGAAARLYTVRSGETAKLVMQPPQHSVSLDAFPAAPGARLAPGVSMSGKTTTIDLEKFLAGTETSLIVTARPR
jgi:hypothetical protein